MNKYKMIREISKNRPRAASAGRGLGRGRPGLRPKNFIKFNKLTNQIKKYSKVYNKIIKSNIKLIIIS